MIYRANDKYQASLRSSWISAPADTTLQVTTLPDNVPTIVTVGWGASYETIFSVAGTSGDAPSNYALTGVTRLRGANENIPTDADVNCLNHEEFFNQYIPYVDMNFRGDYAAGTTYSEGDVVFYNGSSYVAEEETTGNLPTDTDIWILIAQIGASIESAEFSGDDIVFTLTDASTVTLTDAKTELKGDTGISVVDAESLKNATLIEDTTNTDSYAGTMPDTLTAYFTGLVINLKVSNANTGAATLNIDSLGAKSIKINVTEDLPADQIKSGQVVPLVYDGTNFQIVGGGGGTGGADVLAVQVFS